METSHLECPVCLEIFTDPRSLKCNHTLCLKCAQRLSQSNPKQLSCPVCRTITKLKSSVEKSLTSNYALVPIIEAHVRALAAKTASHQPSSSTVVFSPSPGAKIGEILIQQSVGIAPVPLSTVQAPPPRQIISLEHLSLRLQQVAQCQAHLQAAVSSIPNSVFIQQALILEQFSVLRKAVEDNQARALQNLAALQATVTTHLQQELANCNSYAKNLAILSNQYPASVMPIDVPTWNEESEVWSKNLAVMSQHGLVGDFVADIPVAIADPTLSYEGNSVDFASLWSRGKETVTGTVRASPSAEPPKPIHFITQSASGILRRWDFRDAITISEINHPGLRNWSLFEDGTKVVAASAKIKVYDTLSGACLFTFDSLPSPAKKIIAGGRDLKARAISFHVNQGSAALWDLSQGTRLQWDLDISAWNTNLAITSAPDSNLLLIPIIAFPFDVVFFNMLTGDVEPDRLEGFLSEVVDLLPFGNGQFCVTLCSGGSCSIWSLKERRVLKTTQFDAKHNRLTLHVISNKRLFDPEPLLPIIGAYSNLGASFATFDPNTGRSLSFTHNNSVLLTSSLRSMAIFGKGTRALSGHANGKVHVWSLETGACTDTIPMSITGQFTLCNRGHSIVVGTPNGFLNRIDAATCTFQPLLPSVLDGSGIQVQLIGTNFRV